MLAFGVSLLQLQMFFLVFLRTGAFLMALPLVNSPSVPVFFRIGLTFVASLLLFPVLNPGPLPFLADAFSLAVAAAGEILLGVLAGMSIRLVFDGVQLAGQLMGYQMGISIAEVLDPATEDQVALLSQFISLMATLIFLIINGHHAFIRILVQSYELVPPLGFHVNGPVLEGLVRLTAEMFIDRPEGRSAGGRGADAGNRGLRAGGPRRAANEHLRGVHAVEHRRGTDLPGPEPSAHGRLHRRSLGRSAPPRRQPAQGRAVGEEPHGGESRAGTH